MALMPVCSGCVHRLPPGHAGGVGLDRPPLGGDQRRAAVQRIAQRIEHAAQHGIAHGHAEQAAGAAHLVALVDLQVVAQDDDAHRILFEVEGQAVHLAGELDHLAGHDVRQAVDAGDAVAYFDHATDLADVDAGLELFNFLLDYGSDLVGFESHEHSYRSSAGEWIATGWRRSRRRRCRQCEGRPRRSTPDRRRSPESAAGPATRAKAAAISLDLLRIDRGGRGQADADVALHLLVQFSGLLPDRPQAIQAAVPRYDLEEIQQQPGNPAPRRRGPERRTSPRG